MPTTRRNFLRRVGLATAATAVLSPALSPAHAASTPKSRRVLVGSNIYGWGQYYQRMGKELFPNLAEVMQSLRLAGYDYLEGNLDTRDPDNNARFADFCRAKGLQPVCLYTGGRLHDAEQSTPAVERILAAARVCKDAGFSVIDCNPDPIGRAKTEPELAMQVWSLDQIGRGLRELGMHFGVHNHTPEMQDSAREFHHNLRRCDPQAVGLCYDVHWVFRGGVRPPAVLSEYGRRIVSLHLRQSRQNVWFEELAEGDVDYAPIAKFLQDRRAAAPLTVELALERGTVVTRDVVENHRRSREWVRQTFGH